MGLQRVGHDLVTEQQQQYVNTQHSLTCSWDLRYCLEWWLLGCDIVIAHSPHQALKDYSQIVVLCYHGAIWLLLQLFIIFLIFFSSSVQLLSCVWLFATPWTVPHQPSLSITNSWSLLKLMSIESVMTSSHFILCHPLLPLPSIFPSIRVFSNESVLCIRWPKYWSFSFSISPYNECSGLISFRIDGFVLLAVEGTQELSPIPQFKSINSALSFLYSPTLTPIHDHWKNHSFD